MKYLACLRILSMARACLATDPISSDHEPCKASEASEDSIAIPEYHEVTATQVELLQVHIKRMKTPTPHQILTDTRQETSGGNHRYLLESARDLFPMVWVHVPKCGSTLFNSLIHLPGACDLPHDINPETDVAGARFTGTWVWDLNFIDKYCPGSFARFPDTHPEERFRLPYSHQGIGSVYDSIVKGHGIIMLRQPEQRIASGYYADFHSWPSWKIGRDPDDMKEYAQFVSGCAVKILTQTGKPCGDRTGDTRPSTDRDAQIAVDRIRSGFVFVGITEEWSMSVCLLHMMFGGECAASEFGNSHPGANSSSDLYDVAELQGFIDVHDGLLYDAAKLIFRENLNKFGATPSTCEPCFRQSSLASSF